MKKTTKQSWIGTIPIFLIIVSGILSMIIGLYFVGIDLFSFMGYWPSVFFAILFATTAFLAILNIPVPRRKSSPTSDLEHLDKLTEGAWCTVHINKEDREYVIKQIYPCGWGHNDYTKHTAPVIGKKKICGKWNPLCLWVIHNYMVWYTLIGLRRRQKFEGQIDAFPATKDLNTTKLRYKQPFIPLEFNNENCPNDILDQFHLLNEQLKACGLYLDDVHAGNVRLTIDKKIQIIDGELYSGGEEWVKTRLVKFFNGSVVSGMAKVLGFDRIISWVDHRQSVDEVISNRKP